MQDPNIKFHENPSSRSCADTCGQTDVHDKTNRIFSQPLERVWSYWNLDKISLLDFGRRMLTKAEKTILK